MIAGPAEFLLNVNVLLPQDGKISGIGATLAATKTNFVSYFAPARPGHRWPVLVTSAGLGWCLVSVELRPARETQVSRVSRQVSMT